MSVGSVEMDEEFARWTGSLPLDQVKTRGGLNNVADFTRLQCERSVFKLLLHIASAKESPMITRYVSFRI